MLPPEEIEKPTDSKIDDRDTDSSTASRDTGTLAIEPPGLRREDDREVGEGISANDKF